MQSDQCRSCVNYLGGLACEAFPVEIPQEILDGTFDHRNEYEGDNGIRWQQNPEVPDLVEDDSEGDE